MAWILGLVVLGTVLGAGDWYMRMQEMDRLLDAVERSERAMEASQDGFRAILEEAPERPTNAQRRQVREGYAEVAAGAAADVIDTQDRVASVSILPWHRKLSAAQNRYLDHSESWADYYKDLARDVDEFRGQRPEITATFRIAVRALRNAVPNPHPWGKFKRRINAIAAE